MTMNTSVTPFNYQGHDFRTFADANGVLTFVAADVAVILGHTSAKDMTRSLDPDEKGGRLVPTPGGEQEMTTITEAGLYQAILQRQTGRMVDDAQRAAVKAFQRWVTHEVLPSIRKTGTYGAPSLSGPELLARAVIEAAQQIKELTGRADSAEQRVAELGPRAFAFDRWLSGNTAYSVDVVAKALRQAGAMTGRNRLFDFMEKAGWIFRQSGQWKPKQHVIEQKLLTVRLGSYEDSHTGELVSTTTVRITAKGAAKLAALHGVVQEDVAATLGGGEPDAA